jgi:hypothetical protein
MAERDCLETERQIDWAILTKIHRTALAAHPDNGGDTAASRRRRQYTEKLHAISKKSGNRNPMNAH